MATVRLRAVWISYFHLNSPETIPSPFFTRTARLPGRGVMSKTIGHDALSKDIERFKIGEGRMSKMRRLA
jgi:hypothetical protein